MFLHVLKVCVNTDMRCDEHVLNITNVIVDIAFREFSPMRSFIFVYIDIFGSSTNAQVWRSIYISMSMRSADHH